MPVWENRAAHLDPRGAGRPAARGARAGPKVYHMYKNTFRHSSSSAYD